MIDDTMVPKHIHTHTHSYIHHFCIDNNGNHKSVYFFADVDQIHQWTWNYGRKEEGRQKESAMAHHRSNKKKKNNSLRPEMEYRTSEEPAIDYGCIVRSITSKTDTQACTIALLDVCVGHQCVHWWKFIQNLMFVYTHLNDFQVIIY